MMSALQRKRPYKTERKNGQKKEKEDQKNGRGLVARLREGLTKTSSGFTGRLDQLLFGKKEISEDLLENLEEILFTSDLGVATTQELIRLVQEGVARKELDACLVSSALAMFIRSNSQPERSIIG